MKLLFDNPSLSFNEIQEKTNLTAGNLYSHCKVLLTENYIYKTKKDKNGKIITCYEISPLGVREFQKYIDTLIQFLKDMKLSKFLSKENTNHNLPPSKFIEITDLEGNRLNVASFK